MSSHHIVRDNQEPALIIANGEPCSRAVLDDLLSWGPYVLVIDGALNKAKDLGIKIDAVLGDFDSVNDLNSIITALQPIEVVHTPDQDLTDLEKGIRFLIEKGHKAVNIVWATGRRADHNFANLSNIVKFFEIITINIIDDYSRIFQLPRYFKKYYPAKTIISLMPIGTVTNITTKNLLYPLNGESLSIGHRIGTSNNVVETGWIEIKHEKGSLLLMECFD